MESNNITYERELDLKDLIFAVLHKWRLIVIVALVFALGIGAFKAAMTYRSEMDEEAVEKRQEDYEADLKNYQTKLESCDREIENLERTIEEQEEYLEKSVLLDISPYNVCEARTDIFVRNNYEIMPGMTYQNVNYIDSILQAYQSLMSSTAFCETIAKKMNMTVRYYRELVTVERASYILTIKVRQKDEETAEKIMNYIMDDFGELQKDIDQNIGEHTVNVIDSSVGTYVDLTLGDTQRAAETRLRDLQTSLENKQKEKEDLEKPEMVSSVGVNVLTNGGKYALLGALLGAFMVIFFVCVIFVMSDKLYSSKDLSLRFRVKLLGELMASEKKKNKIDLFLERMEGRAMKLNEEEALDVVAANILNFAGEKKKLLLTGSIAEDLLEKLKGSLEQRIGGLELIASRDMLQQADTLKRIPQCDGVVLAEQEHTSSLSVINREIELVNDLGKEVIGCIVYR